MGLPDVCVHNTDAQFFMTENLFHVLMSNYFGARKTKDTLIHIHLTNTTIHQICCSHYCFKTLPVSREKSSRHPFLGWYANDFLAHLL